MSRNSAMDPVFHVKDGLRRIRYRVRQAAGETEAPPFDLPDLPPPVAFVADSMASVVEAVRGVLLRDAYNGARGWRAAAPVREYIALAAKPRESSHAFTTLTYRVYKSFARQLGAGEALISEVAIERARRSFVDGLEERSDAGRRGPRGPATIRDGALLAVSLAKARPIKRIVAGDRASGRGRHFADDPNVFLACAIGLSACIAESEPPGKGARSGAFVTAEAAIDARFARMSEALASLSPVDALTAEFSTIVSFLASP